MKKKCFALIGAAFLVANPGRADTAEAAEEAASPVAVGQLDGFTMGLAQGGAFSGVLLVAKDGEILLERAYGNRDEREDDKNTIDTRFNLASAGKMFTAVAV